ncbi:hypothetical protein MASR1M32_21830 [Rhodobacter sp.]
MSSTFRKPAAVVILLSATALAGCATNRPPEISYDANVPPLPAIPASVTDDRPRPLHIPPAWTVARGGQTASTATGRVENANAAARVQPRREGYFNAIQVYPWSEGALYQVYAAPGQITNIALEPGESLTGAGPIAAGDTARWIIGDTESGSGVSRRVHVLVKPTRADITTNLVITTDRRTYMVELRSGEKPYMPAVAWAYPQPAAGGRQAIPATPVIPAVAARNYRYGLTGSSNPPPCGSPWARRSLRRAIRRCGSPPLNPSARFCRPVIVNCCASSTSKRRGRWRSWPKSPAGPSPTCRAP